MFYDIFTAFHFEQKDMRVFLQKDPKQKGKSQQWLYIFNVRKTQM